MMEVTIKVSREFERQAKRLAKKYRTFVDDFTGFLNGINENPYQVVDLGGGKRKIRMAIASKGKDICRPEISADPRLYDEITLRYNKKGRT